MKLSDLSRSEQAKILADYHDNRDIGREVFKSLRDCLTRDSVMKAAKNLGLPVGREIVAQNENELTVMFGYAYHHQSSGAFNTIERFANMHPDVVAEYPGFFDSLSESFYSVFSVLSVTPGIGISVEDMLTGEALPGNDCIACRCPAIHPTVCHHGACVSIC